MKKTLTLFALLSFLFTQAQFNEGTIYLKDSTELKGLIKPLAFGRVKYKENKGSKAEQFEDILLTGYDIKRDGVIEKYRYKKVGANFPRRMKIVSSGKVNLYSVFVSNAGTSIAMGLPVAEGNVFFLEKNDITTRIGAKFKKGKYYLVEDCPSLINKIQKKEFKKIEVIEIVDFYNKNCN